MATKLGGGGHAQESYDSQTGKYVKSSGGSKPFATKITNDNSSQGGTTPSWLGSQSTSTTATYKSLDQMTVQEMHAEIQAAIPYLEQQFDYKNNFGKLFGGDIKLQCAYARYTKELLEKFPLNLNKKMVVRANASLNAFGGCAGVPSSASNGNTILKYYEVVFSSKLLNDANHVKAKHQGEIKMRFKMPVDDEHIYAYTAIHEYGHLFETALLRQFNTKENIHTIKQAIVDIYNKNYPNTDFKKRLSQYGQSHDAEAFAEIFTNMNGGNENKLGAAMREYLQSKGYNI